MYIYSTPTAICIQVWSVHALYIRYVSMQYIHLHKRTCSVHTVLYMVYTFVHLMFSVHVHVYSCTVYNTVLQMYISKHDKTVCEELNFDWHICICTCIRCSTVSEQLRTCIYQHVSINMHSTCGSHP